MENLDILYKIIIKSSVFCIKLYLIFAMIAKTKFEAVNHVAM